MSDIYNLLGLCRRANQLIFGEPLFKALRSHKVKLIVISKDASKRTEKQLLNKCAYYRVPYIYFSDSNMLSHAIGKNNIKSLGITDAGFAQKMIIIDRNEVG